MRSSIVSRERVAAGDIVNQTFRVIFYWAAGSSLQFRGPAGFANAVYQLDRIEQGVRAGDRAVLHLVALFQGPEGDGLVRQINALWRQLQGFRDSAPGVGQRQAEGTHLSALVRVGRRHESALFLSSQIFTFSVNSEQFAG